MKKIDHRRFPISYLRELLNQEGIDSLDSLPDSIEVDNSKGLNFLINGDIDGVEDLELELQAYPEFVVDFQPEDDQDENTLCPNITLVFQSDTPMTDNELIQWWEEQQESHS